MWTKLVALLAILSFFSPAEAATNNILVILADDMGIGVTSFYKTSIRSQTSPAPPTLSNLQTLAANGITFSRNWATPWCSPTRASVLTGRYGFRHGLGVPIDQSGSPAVVLATSEKTLPEIVGTSTRSYMMRHIGKWHLGEDVNNPNTHGWTNYVGPHPGAGGPASVGTGSPDYFNWRKYTNGGSGVITTTYATTDQVDEALSTITAANTANRPYFIWLAFNAPHAPFHKPPNDLHTRDGLPATGGAIRDYYEATIEAMDTEIGRLLASVNLSSTTVIFMGDNGTPTNIEIAPYTAAHGKGTIYTGGSNTALVIAGLGVTNPGRYVTAVVNCVDLFPTIIQLAGLDPATETAGIKTDGVSLTPYMSNTPHPKPREFAYSEQFTSVWNVGWERTIRNADFALIERAAGAREFYNITNDPLETTNILSRTRTNIEDANLTALDVALDALIATR